MVVVLLKAFLTSFIILDISLRPQSPLCELQSDRNFIDCRSSTLDDCFNPIVIAISISHIRLTILNDISILRPGDSTILCIERHRYTLQIVEFSINSSEPHVILLIVCTIVLTRSKRNALAILTQRTLNPSLGDEVADTLYINVLVNGTNLQSLLNGRLALTIIEVAGEEPVLSLQFLGWSDRLSGFILGNLNVGDIGQIVNPVFCCIGKQTILRAEDTILSIVGHFIINQTCIVTTGSINGIAAIGALYL